MDFPLIPEDFDSMDGASFDFDNFIFGTGDAEAMQSGIGTFAIAGATKIVGTNCGVSSHPFGSQSHPRPFVFSRGFLIPIFHSLETHTWTTHHRQVGFYSFAIFIAPLIMMLA